MTTVGLHELNANASNLITDALCKLLSFSSTQQTIAQIIDNMPIQGHYYGLNYLLRHPHPEIERRAAPSHNATQLARKFCSELDLTTIAIDAQTAERFQNELQLSPSSVTTARRLLELISALIHDLASSIYHELHPTPPRSQGFHDEGRLEHRAYQFSAAYKHEDASVVGYWAETDIFGGPLLFAKGRHGTECSAAFVHLTNPAISAQTEIVELNDEQVHSFLIYVTLAGDCPLTEICAFPLPFNVTNDARRLTIEEAVSENIYRDYGQLSHEWESARRFERSKTSGWRADGTRGCVWEGPANGSG